MPFEGRIRANRFINGLQQALKTEVLSGDCEDLEKAVRLATRMEKDQAERKAKAPAKAIEQPRPRTDDQRPFTRNDRRDRRRLHRHHGIREAAVLPPPPPLGPALPPPWW